MEVRRQRDQPLSVRAVHSIAGVIQAAEFEVLLVCVVGVVLYVTQTLLSGNNGAYFQAFTHKPAPH